MDERILYALTGPPRCGKTTAILKIVNELKRRAVKVEGMYTAEIREQGRRIGFSIKRISGGEGILAHVKFGNGPRHGKYTVNLIDLENIGVSAILDGIERAEVVIVDEVGPMELYSEKFKKAVGRLLSSNKHAILTVHYRSRDPLAAKIKKMAGENLIILSQENRDRIPSIIVKNVVEALNKG
ncbi:MAG: NTPase [Thaumarchaeota archaeon]|nr:NTPase [Nitrososphaerota archaeon]